MRLMIWSTSCWTVFKLVLATQKDQEKDKTKNMKIMQDVTVKSDLLIWELKETGANNFMIMQAYLSLATIVFLFPQL